VLARRYVRAAIDHKTLQQRNAAIPRLHPTAVWQPRLSPMFQLRSTLSAGLLLLVVFGNIGFAAGPRTAPTRVTLNADHVLVLDGEKIFPIGFTLPPPFDGVTPEGKNGLQELADAGGTFMRTGTSGSGWTDATVAREQQWMDAAAAHGMYCWPFLRELASIGPRDAKREARLREVVNRFKDHPGLLVWKGEDEPEWGKKPVAPLVRAREIIRELDPHHPVVIIQAPRGTVQSLRPYNAAADIIGADIYPIGYPPGMHSLLPNKELSQVGDYTRTMMEVAEGRLPVWMVLQISWSGVLKPGKTLRMPTFPEERFMIYEAIINGARGLNFFGGANAGALNPRDAKLGWNWTFWQRVLKPLVEEIGRYSPLHPALVAPNSRLPVKVTGAGMEWCVREVGRELFVLACKRDGATLQATFSGLPAAAGDGEVMFEAPRRVQARDGRFTDWFAPFEVHVYRFRL
jgi:hypothetical protein